eukprot:13948280-Alexandrium_andersonii.AAC.1
MCIRDRPRAGTGGWALAQLSRRWQTGARATARGHPAGCATPWCSARGSAPASASAAGRGHRS